MKRQITSDEGLRNDVRELTESLRGDASMDRIREELASAGHDPLRIIMGGLIESEGMEVWGTFVERPQISCWYFETDRNNRITLLEQRAPADVADEFPAVNVAVEIATEEKE